MVFALCRFVFDRYDDLSRQPLKILVEKWQSINITHPKCSNQMEMMYSLNNCIRNMKRNCARWFLHEPIVNATHKWPIGGVIYNIQERCLVSLFDVCVSLVGILIFIIFLFCLVFPLGKRIAQICCVLGLDIFLRSVSYILSGKYKYRILAGIITWYSCVRMVFKWNLLTCRQMKMCAKGKHSTFWIGIIFDEENGKRKKRNFFSFARNSF